VEWQAILTRLTAVEQLQAQLIEAQWCQELSGSIATCLQSIGQPMPHDRGVIPVPEAGTIVKALRQQHVWHGMQDSQSDGGEPEEVQQHGEGA